MKLTCPKCRSPREMETASPFTNCENCKSSLYIDLDRVVEVYSFTPQIKAVDIPQYLERDLKKKGFKEEIEITDAEPVYFPFWRREENSRLDRASAQFSDRTISMPSETAVFFSPADAREKGVPLVAIDTQPNENTPRTLWLIPFFAVRIGFREEKYTLFVNAVTGEVNGDPLPYMSPEKTFKLFPLFISIFLVLVLINAIFDNMPIAALLSFLAIVLFYRMSMRGYGQKYHKERR